MVRHLFEKCFLCIDLRSGCLIIGYIQLVMNLVFVASAAIMLMGGGLVPPEDKVWLMYTWLAWGAVVLGGLMVLFAAMLLLGLHCDCRCLVLSYLLFAALFVTLTMPLFLLSFWGSASPQSMVRDIFNIVWGTLGIYTVRRYCCYLDAPPADEAGGAAA